MKVLVIDIGGNSVKFLITGGTEPRKLPSGPALTPRHSPESGALRGLEIRRRIDRHPGRVRDNQIVAEPVNLGPGWVHFDFAKAFGCPVRVMNDAAMQALGSYRHGKMLFLGLGTGLGSALVVEGSVMPMELGQLPVQGGDLRSDIWASKD